MGHIGRVCGGWWGETAGLKAILSIYKQSIVTTHTYYRPCSSKTVMINYRKKKKKSIYKG
jgi:hypothetical protein